MKYVDMDWMDNPEWWDVDDNDRVYIKNDAPQEAKDSFQRYREQTKEKK